jgi:hypothetical protein
MNRDLMQAFVMLRPSEQAEVMRDVGVTFQKGASESKNDFYKRVLQAIAHDGKVRELEQAMLAFQ